MHTKQSPMRTMDSNPSEAKVERRIFESTEGPNTPLALLQDYINTLSDKTFLAIQILHETITPPAPLATHITDGMNGDEYAKYLDGQKSIYSLEVVLTYV